jgi:hypothetical protein
MKKKTNKNTKTNRPQPSSCWIVTNHSELEAVLRAAYASKSLPEEEWVSQVTARMAADGNVNVHEGGYTCLAHKPSGPVDVPMICLNKHSLDWTAFQVFEERIDAELPKGTNPLILRLVADQALQEFARDHAATIKTLANIAWGDLELTSLAKSIQLAAATLRDDQQTNS